MGLVYERPVDLERETIDPPQAPLAKWGPPDDILAGRDLRAHGTWLGLDRRPSFGHGATSSGIARPGHDGGFSGVRVPGSRGPLEGSGHSGATAPVSHRLPRDGALTAQPYPRCQAAPTHENGASAPICSGRHP